MNLPERIPKKLRQSALLLPEFSEGEAAWSKDDAIAVLESLKSTTVPVSDVVLYERAPWGYAPSESTWSAERYQNEADTDYAARSRSGAAEFIRRCGYVAGDALFAMTFPMWKDA